MSNEISKGKDHVRQRGAQEYNEPQSILTITDNATKERNHGPCIHLEFWIFCFYNFVKEQGYSFPSSFIITT